MLKATVDALRAEYEEATEIARGLNKPHMERISELLKEAGTFSFVLQRGITAKLNFSDTMDYSDWRTTNEAVRVVTKYSVTLTHAWPNHEDSQKDAPQEVLELIEIIDANNATVTKVCQRWSDAHDLYCEEHNRIERDWTPGKGDEVVVFKGRKVPRGTKGELFWLGEDSYGKARAGVRCSNGEVCWTALSNLQVV